MVKSPIDGKRTKIVATLGPASWDRETIRQMVAAGMNVARINFSHGDHERHAETIAIVREVAEEAGAVVAIMADIQGPKIRLGVVADEPVTIRAGDTIVLTEDEVSGEEGVYQLPHPEFIQDIKAGERLLLDDGNLEFVVKQAHPKKLVCEVVVGGKLRSRKGVMAPNSHLTLPAITDKDRQDIEFALLHNVDYIAMSFVRSAEDIKELQWLIRHLGGQAAIIAKIEKHEALENIEGIIEETDGIMVARGDLGLEVAAERVPYHQKRIIRLCNEAAKPVITATQMLSSMVDSPRPTRAEASDVYNAIVDGTDAVMLSNETAVGKYPVRAVETMATIAVMAEQQLWEEKAPHWRLHGDANEKSSKEIISDAISEATSRIAQMLHAKAIVTSTMSGYTALRVARERTKTPIICVTPNEITYRRMALVWGVIPLLVPEYNTIDEMISTIVRAAYDEGLVEADDMLIIIAGVPFGHGGQTNLLKIQRVGEAGEL